MKALYLLKRKIAASVGLLCLFTFSIAKAAQITWVETGTFTNDAVLALAGPVSNEVYGVDFGGSDALTTTNGYTFGDYGASGDLSMAGSISTFNGYLGGGGTTSDAAFDSVLGNGIYGGTDMQGTLNNLTIGKTYTIMALLADTRGAPTAGHAFEATDGITISPTQEFAFTGGSPAMGGFIIGIFTATATTQAFSLLNQDTSGHYDNSQYNAILLETNPPPLAPLLILITNTEPASAGAGVGGQMGFTAAFSNSPSVNLQWQVIANGVTNNINTGVLNVTNFGVVSSTLMLTNLQLNQAGSYLLEAINATNSSDVAFSTAASLRVSPLIFWEATGTFTNDSVLALAGPVSNEVYGVDFGGSGAEMTTNGYSFDDYASSGNMSISGGGFGLFGGFLDGGGTTGDGGLDTLLTFGLYGSSANTGTLNNLTVGQTYNVIALLSDTRTGAGSQNPETAFYATEGVYDSPDQSFVFPAGTPAIGGYVLGTFTALSTNEPLSLVTQDTSGNYDNSQYSAILLERTTAPQLPPIYLAADTQPATATAGEGGQARFTAAFVNSPAVTLQWQFISNGVTNNISTGLVNTTNNGIVTSTLNLSQLQLTNSGAYRLEAINATNSTDFVYSTPAALVVVPVITWVSNGTFGSDAVLALAGPASNEVYGVDFGGSGAQTTINGYSFADYAASGDMSIAGGGFGQFGGYLTGGATTGDAGMDTILTYGLYGSTANTGTLNNLTVGRTYTVLALLDDTRGSAAGGITFTTTDGVTTSPSQAYAFTNGEPAVGGYILGTFTATATTQSFSVENLNVSVYSSQYNAILLEAGAPPAIGPLTIGTVRVLSGNLVLTGAGGTPGSSYTWLSTTNLSAPISWTTNTAGIVDGSGSFSNSIPIGSVPAMFFRLREP
ncbi:MAG: hypothetical protein ABSE48_15490 [Verrucomicrobiota bacterium]